MRKYYFHLEFYEKVRERFLSGEKILFILKKLTQVSFIFQEKIFQVFFSFLM